MHGGAARLVGNGHQFVGVVIGGHAEQALFPAFLAGQADMARGRVLGGVHGREGHAQLAAGPHDAYGDLAPVGHQNFMLGQRNFRGSAFGGAAGGGLFFAAVLSFVQTSLPREQCSSLLWHARAARPP